MENMDLERFADLLRRMIEKYAEKIDWDSLPDPPEGLSVNTEFPP